MRKNESEIGCGMILLRMSVYAVSVVLASVLTPRLCLALLGTTNPPILMYSVIIMVVVYVIGGILIQIPNFLQERKEQRATQDDDFRR